MIPAAFDYAVAESVDDAIALLAEHGDDAKLLAGGMSLIPLMKLRLATPSVLVDGGRVQDLSYVTDAGDAIAHPQQARTAKPRAVASADVATSPHVMPQSGEPVPGAGSAPEPSGAA